MVAAPLWLSAHQKTLPAVPRAIPENILKNIWEDNMQDVAVLYFLNIRQLLMNLPISTGYALV